MAALSILLLFFLGAWVLASIKAPLWTWTIATGVGLTILTLGGYLTPGLPQFVWVLWLVVALLNVSVVRQQLLMAPLLALYRRHLPTLSTTEREALEAGTVWWEAELFSGHPHWERLLNLPPPRLSDEEQAFLEGPTEELCRMLDDWRITHELRDLPPEVW